MSLISSNASPPRRTVIPLPFLPSSTPHRPIHTFECLVAPTIPTPLPLLPTNLHLAPLVVSSSVTPLPTRGIYALTSSPTSYSSLVMSFSMKMWFPLLAPLHPPILTLFSSLIPFHLHPRRPALHHYSRHAWLQCLRSRLSPHHVRHLHLRSHSFHATHSHVDPAYATRGLVNQACATRTPVDEACVIRGPVDPTYVATSTSAARFTDLALVYHQHGCTTP